MKRPSRLRAAPAFLATYHGKHVVKGYAKWFRVDLGLGTFDPSRGWSKTRYRFEGALRGPAMNVGGRGPGDSHP